MPASEAAVARGLFASALVRDWSAVAEAMAADVVWELDGGHALAARYRGRRAVLGAMQRLLEGTRGTFKPVLPQSWNIEVRGHHVILADWYGTTRGGRWLNGCLVFVISVEDGQVSRMMVSFHDERDFVASAM